MSNTEFKIAVTVVLVAFVSFAVYIAWLYHGNMQRTIARQETREAEKEKISASCAIWHIPQGSSTRECICFVNEPCVNYMTGQIK